MRRLLFFFIVIPIMSALPNISLADRLMTDEMLRNLKLDYSRQAYNRGVTINKLLSNLKNEDISIQLKEVNRFFNQFRYREDFEQWGKKDYWATPEEFIGTQYGDCEDFVIAKYFSLRKLGVPDNKLYLTYVKSLDKNIAHMVLSYFELPTSIPLVLDNYNPRILRANKRKDLLPVYSFNASSLFLSNAAAGLGQSLPTGKIRNSKWQKLLSDLKQGKQ